ncbi:Diaminopimelate epimerase [uncultured delta proteobacterium]|uniref:Diaminopimelate epimerase n=1 Tax=uncultured delta proteobacterium TaxID=34034 RepID=A0A212JW11_9DELT|nr:Diaminopimelate epimerase [uncultured delta proteobacterium]
MNTRATIENRFRFTKMEGLGNDYVYAEEFGKPIKNAPEIARLVSDRHFGVGSDGLILIGSSDKADFRMRMFNADGSEGEMCGNGIRCVGKYVYDYGLTLKTAVTVETLAGIRNLKLNLSGYRVQSVRVDMGQAILEPKKIPIDATGKDYIDREIVVDGKTYRGTAVSMGNPHFVIPVDDVDKLDLAAMGPSFEHHKLFPKRVNTEFVQILSKKEVRMRVWERGSGETLACGTGACATAVACALNGWTDRKVTVHLLGGDLFIEWDKDNTVYMTGPATTVFDGEYLLPHGVTVG